MPQRKKAAPKPPVIERFPKLDNIAEQIANQVFFQINQRVKDTKTNTPYKAQYILEELIKRLETRV